MILSHPDINSNFDFELPVVNSLIIENPAFFNSFLSDIYSQYEGGEGFAVLSENFSPVPFSKNTEILSQFVPFNINQKNIITKLYKVLEKNSISEDFYLQTQEIIRNIEKWIFDISFSLPLDIEPTKISAESLIKSAGPVFIEDNSSSLVERIFDFMEIVRELDRDKLFIFVNLRSYITDEECRKFYESVISHGFKILMIDSSAKQPIETEKRVIIDEDLCEI